MTFTIVSLTRCAGQNHWSVTMSFPGGAVRTLETDKDEVQVSYTDAHPLAREAMLTRLRSAVKEAGALTFAQAKTALEGKTFQI